MIKKKSRTYLVKTAFLLISLLFLYIIIKFLIRANDPIFIFVIIILVTISIFRFKWAIFLFIFSIPLFSHVLRYEYFTAPYIEVMLFSLSVSYFSKIVFSKKKIHFYKTKINKLLLIFLILLIFSAIHTLLINIGFNQSLNLFLNLDNYLFFSHKGSEYSFVRYFFTFIEGGLILLLIINNFKTKKDIKLIVWSLILPLTLIALHGAYKFLVFDYSNVFRGINRAFGLFTGPNIFGSYLIMLLPLCLFLIFYYKGIHKKYFILLGFITFTVLIFSHSRSNWIGLGIAIIIYLTYTHKHYFVSKKSVVVILIMILIISLSLGVFISNKEDIELQRLSTGRYYIWEAGINMIKTHPFLGVGMGNFYRDLNEYYDKDIIPWTKHEHAHNMYLQIFAEQGIFNFIVFILIICQISIIGFKKLNNLKENSYKKYVLLGAFFGFIAILAESLLDYTLLTAPLFLIFAILISLIIKV